MSLIKTYSTLKVPALIAQAGSFMFSSVSSPTDPKCDTCAKQCCKTDPFNLDDALECRKRNTCWNCGNTLSDSPTCCPATSLFCGACNKLQLTPQSPSHFDILGIEPKFDIDSRNLRRVYRDIQKVTHPDRWASAQEELTLSEENTARVNDAFSQLRDPLSRAEHMLELAGYLPSPLSPVSLLGHMSRREQIEEGEGLRGIEEELAQEYDAAKEAFGAAARDGDWDTASSLVSEMNYIQREIEDVEDRIFHQQ
eukprot:gnl/Dysnectes_brevis/3401_a4280_728.p1 GENE.gnl/Dysnectes_brevis/3401_a4280_728~~gnl/Dysnectes_brevis/3401_a4280_728.p1  ORF type:complete len:253 (+),score=69.60 gnl/Dysnectes_brevis/3401_a4280_728:42-800(+)